MKFSKDYEAVSALVRSGDKWRVFITSASFTIRPLVVYLQRYNPDFEIVAVKYGYFPSGIPACNTQWTKLSNSEALSMTERIAIDDVFKKPLDITNLKPYLLENYPYRKAINLWYWFVAEHAIYPGKNPFKGVKVSNVPEWLRKQVGNCEFLTFLSDEDNPYIEKADILKWYDGRPIERMYNGQKVKGYILTECRQDNGQKPFIYG